MTETGADFTNTFRALCDAAAGANGPIRAQLGDSALVRRPGLRRWQRRLASESINPHGACRRDAPCESGDHSQKPPGRGRARCGGRRRPRTARCAAARRSPTPGTTTLRPPISRDRPNRMRSCRKPFVEHKGPPWHRLRGTGFAHRPTGRIIPYQNLQTAVNTGFWAPHLPANFGKRSPTASNSRFSPRDLAVAHPKRASHPQWAIKPIGFLILRYVYPVYRPNDSPAAFSTRHFD